MLRSRQLWLGILGTALFLGLFFWRTDLGDMANALADANYWWFAPAIALWFVSAWFRSLRWRYLLRPIADLPARTLYPVVVIGYMANNLLPARTGELVRAYIMGERHRLSLMATLGTISVERLFDGLVLLAFLVFVGAFVGLSEELTILAIAMSAIFVVLLAVSLYVASSAERAQRVIEGLVRFAPARVRDRARGWAGRLRGRAGGAAQPLGPGGGRGHLDRGLGRWRPPCTSWWVSPSAWARPSLST